MTVTPVFQAAAKICVEASALLGAADGILGKARWSPYDWPAIWPTADTTAGPRSQHVGQAYRWVPWYAQRHYRPPHGGADELVVVSTLFYDPWDPEMTTAKCIASNFRTSSQPSLVYLIALAQTWARDPAQRLSKQTVQLRPDDLDLDDDPKLADVLRSVVEDQPILSVARPLDEITTIDTLRAEVIEPLLSARAAP